MYQAVLSFIINEMFAFEGVCVGAEVSVAVAPEMGRLIPSSNTGCLQRAKQELQRANLLPMPAALILRPRRSGAADGGARW